MTERLPYLVLRDFRVWFQQRLGFFAALMRAKSENVRAVDGIDLDIGKGEIYCLVGESGCGKTTTGKGILRLVEPTGGDVFVELKPSDLAAYEVARAKRDEAFLEEFRQMHSLSYKEKVIRSTMDVLMNALFAAGATLMAAFLTLQVVLGLRAIGADVAETLVYVLTGVAVSFVGTLPYVKLSHGLARLLAACTLLATFFAHLLIAASSVAGTGHAVNLGSVLGAYVSVWQSNAFILALLQYLVAFLATWSSTRLLIDYWRHKKGFEADRLGKLRKTLQIIFQDPYESLNPRHTVYDIVAEPLLVNRLTGSRAETEARVEKSLHDAGLRPPRDFLLRFPHELSGGQRQRVSIAGALVLEPDFLVADEPVSMLDVSIRTEIIELLLELRKQRGLTYLFITHDLSLAWVLADRIGVMYLGKIVEQGPTRELIQNPRHPYTKALISVVPVPDPDMKHTRIILKGERPDPADIPAGCRFHPRCPVAFERCGWTSDEVLDTLHELSSSDASRNPKGLALDGPLTILWNEAPEDAEAWLKGLCAEKSDEYRSLKAIRDIEKSERGLKVFLHEFQEPALKVVARDVLVSCHLYE
jgi:oligopeptide/dipeptide ABC transporter ATP-binding protein